MTWEKYISDDGCEHHRCPNCKADAIFDYVTEESWDEDYDGNWQPCGTYISDITEHLTPYCPYCGTRLAEECEGEQNVD